MVAFQLILPLLMGLALLASSSSYDTKTTVLGQASTSSVASNIGEGIVEFAAEEKSPVITYEFDDANSAPIASDSSMGYGKNPIAYGKNPLPMPYGKEPIGKMLIPPPGGMPFKFHFGLDTTVYYDDNLYLSNGWEVDDIVYRISPHFGIDMGDVDGGVDTYGILRYSPHFNIYTDNGSENTIDHDASFEGMYRIQRLAILAYSRFQRQRDAQPNANLRYDEDTFTNALRAVYDVSPKTNLEVGAKNIITDHGGDPGLFDSTEWIYDVVAEYVVSDKTRVGLGYAYGTLDVDGASTEQTYDRPFVRLNWYPSGKLSLDALAGVDLRDLEFGEKDTFVYDVSLQYNPRPGTAMHLTTYRDVEPSVYFEDQNSTDTGVAFKIDQRIGNRWEAGFQVGYEWSDFYAVGPVAVAPRDDEYYFLRPSLTYAFRDWMDLEFWYRYRNNDSTNEAFKYENNQIGISLNMVF